LAWLAKTEDKYFCPENAKSAITPQLMARYLQIFIIGTANEDT
jgi:hypothetical protein